MHLRLVVRKYKTVQHTSRTTHPAFSFLLTLKNGETQKIFSLNYSPCHAILWLEPGQDVGDAHPMKTGKNNNSMKVFLNEYFTIGKKQVDYHR